jgi:hypothetical protein
MAAALAYRTQDWIELNAAVELLLKANGGSYRLALHDLRQALESGVVSRTLVRYFKDGALCEVEYSAYFWRDRRGRIEQGLRKAISSGSSEDYFRAPWEPVALLSSTELPPDKRVYFWRVDFERFLAPELRQSDRLEAPLRDPLAPSESVIDAHVKWLKDEAGRLARDPECPRKIGAFARRLQSKMTAAVKAGTCSKVWHYRTIEAYLRKLSLWPLEQVQ